MTGVSGGYANLGYDWAGGTSWKTFGHGVKLSTHEKKNNAEVIYGIGSREAQFLMGKQYEGELSLEYILSDPWIFKAILGSVDTVDNTSTTGNYSHTFPSSGAIPKPIPIDIVNSVQLDSSNVSFTYNNCFINNTTISLNKDEVVKVTHDLAYETEGYSETLTLASQPDESFNPYAFQHGTLTIGGTTFVPIESFEMTINHNLEPIRGIGSRFNQDVATKQLELTAKGTALLTSANLELLYRTYTGSTTTPTGPSSTGYIEFDSDDNITLTITNGETGADERSITITLSGIAIDTASLPESAEDILNLELNFKIKTISVTAVNDTSAVP